MENCLTCKLDLCDKAAEEGSKRERKKTRATEGGSNELVSIYQPQCLLNDTYPHKVLAELL